MSADANTSEVWGLLQEMLGRPRGAPEKPRVWRFPPGSIFWGILAPLGCLAMQFVLAKGKVLDGLFRDQYAAYEFLGLGYFNAYWLFGYGFLALEMVALVVRLAFGERLGAWNGAIAGVLCIGTMFAIIQGLVLLPYSILGLFFIFGVLGFVPFATAIVFAINAYLSLRDALDRDGATRVACLSMLGAVVVIGAPLAAQWPLVTAIESALEKTANGDEVAIEPFERWTPLALKQRVWQEWRIETNPDRKERFNQAYKRLTGITAAELQQRIDDD